MSKLSWVEHLDAWERFLTELLSVQTDSGEIIRTERQLAILKRVRCAAVLNPGLISSFISADDTQSESLPVDETYCNLNAAQIEAVEKALGASALSLIVGPPGTGKTQVISEICLQLFKMYPGIRILVCSETHVAVNNLINRIASHNGNIRIVRIRDKESDDQVDAYSPSAIVNAYLSWAKKCEFSDVAYSVIESELSNTEDKSLEKALALSSNIVGVTCNRLASYDFKDGTEIFDVAIIDEVCKATLPEILSPLLVSKKAILLGDPKQLPPVFCSEELDVIRGIDDCNLDKYMYIDELFARSQEVVTLSTQYRMNEEIGTMISNLFYGGSLENGRKVSNPDALTWITYKPTCKWPITRKTADKLGVYNDDECGIITSVIDEIRKEDSSCSIAVITPYRAQARKLRDTIGYVEGITIDTVDGFQGKESDVIIFSVTRTAGSFRFLADPRRLNVALSRARDRIIVVGEIEYCRSNVLLADLIEFFKVCKYE